MVDTNTKVENIEIIPAGIWDLSAIRAVERIAFPLDAWPLLEMVGVLTFPSIERWKAEYDGHLIGFVAADIRKSQNIAWIATIAVDPAFRRKGLGNLLLDKVENLVGVSYMRLSVRKSNRGAIKLYHSRGYEQVDIWPEYYSGKEDAIVMEKSLA